MPDQPAGLLAALHAAKLEMPALKKDATNPHFKNRYISLGALTDTVTPILLKHGLLWSTFPCSDANGQPALRYKLSHVASGEVEQDTMPLLLSKSDSQGQGSAISYARRYALQGVLDLVAEDDDDGHAASQRKQNGNALATPADVKAMVAAAQGLVPEQVKLALAACGVEDVKSYGQVPAAKAAAVAKALAGIER